MSYTPNVPTIGQSLGASRPIINSNFQYLNTWAAVNHYFNVANGGRHSFVEMPTLAAVPLAGSRIAAEVTLYTKDSAGVPQLFIVRGTGSDEVRLTTRNDTPTNASNGWSFLPQGLLIQWGSVSNPGSSGTVNFPVTFVTSAPYSVQITPRNDGSHSAFSYWIDGAPSLTQFSYRGSTSGSQRLYWVAIGNG